MPKSRGARKQSRFQVSKNRRSRFQVSKNQRSHKLHQRYRSTETREDLRLKLNIVSKNVNDLIVILRGIEESEKSVPIREKILLYDESQMVTEMNKKLIGINVLIKEALNLLGTLNNSVDSRIEGLKKLLSD